MCKHPKPDFYLSGIQIVTVFSIWLKYRPKPKMSETSEIGKKNPNFKHI